MDGKGKILILDDNPEFFDPLIEELEARDYFVKKVDKIRDARDIFLNGRIQYNLILVDLVFGKNPQEKQGLAFMGWLEEREVDIKKIVVTIDNEQQTAINAFREFQIVDFFNKDKIDIAKWLSVIISTLGSSMIQTSKGEKSFDNNSAEENQRVEDYCRSLIAEDKIIDCIQILLKTEQIHTDFDVRDMLNAFSGRWVSNEKDRINGILSKADYKLEKETIRQATLEIIKKIESNT